MVKGKDYYLSLKHNAWSLPNLNYRSALLEVRQQSCLLPSVVPSTFPANIAVPIFPVSCLPDFTTRQSYGPNGYVQKFPDGMNGSHPTWAAHIGNSQLTFINELEVKAAEDDLIGCRQRRFLIFDKSGHQTRMFSSAFCSPWQNPSTRCTDVRTCGLHDENQAAMDKLLNPLKPIIHEEPEENCKFGEGNEMHENTEEINALLYSDDEGEDEANDDGGHMNDEVTSTGRSPSIIRGTYEKHEQVEEIIEEVASSDNSAKRRRLFDGGYKASSSMHASRSLQLDRNSSYDENDAEPYCGSGRIRGIDVDSITRKKPSGENRIREMLSFLESIIPGGLKSNDTLLIIDEAISYLKHLKREARALGVNSL